MSRIHHRCKESLSRNHEKGTEKWLGNLELKSPRTWWTSIEQKQTNTRRTQMKHTDSKLLKTKQNKPWAGRRRASPRVCKRKVWWWTGGIYGALDKVRSPILGDFNTWSPVCSTVWGGLGGCPWWRKCVTGDKFGELKDFCHFEVGLFASCLWVEK